MPYRITMYTWISEKTIYTPRWYHNQASGSLSYRSRRQTASAVSAERKTVIRKVQNNLQKIIELTSQASAIFPESPVRGNKLSEIDIRANIARTWQYAGCEEFSYPKSRTITAFAIPLGCIVISLRKSTECIRYSFLLICFKPASTKQYRSTHLLIFSLYDKAGKSMFIDVRSGAGRSASPTHLSCSKRHTAVTTHQSPDRRCNVPTRVYGSAGGRVYRRNVRMPLAVGTDDVRLTMPPTSLSLRL